MTSTPDLIAEAERANKIVEAYSQQPGFRFLTAHWGKTYAWFGGGRTAPYMVPFDLEAEAWRIEQES